MILQNKKRASDTFSDELFEKPKRECDCWLKVGKCYCTKLKK